MASSRKNYKEGVKLRVLQIIKSKPQMSSRELAQKVGISNGSAYYLLTSLIDKGLIKLSNLQKSSKKTKYSYLLIPKGIREKSLITSKYLECKKFEYKLLKKEIAELEKDESLNIES